jgi:hypothetical protein
VRNARSKPKQLKGAADGATEKKRQRQNDRQFWRVWRVSGRREVFGLLRSSKSVGWKREGKGRGVELDFLIRFLFVFFRGW